MPECYNRQYLRMSREQLLEREAHILELLEEVRGEVLQGKKENICLVLGGLDDLEQCRAALAQKGHQP